MLRTWKFLFLLTMFVLLLAGCANSLEDRSASGVIAAKEAFFANSKDQTEEIEGIKLYKPAGFIISEKSDAYNIIFKKGNETFLLFINPNEKEDSRLFYDLLLADKGKEIIAEETFSDDGNSGFVAIIKNDDESVELVVSVGGAKMTTITKKKKLEKEVREMMEVVRSLK